MNNNNEKIGDIRDHGTGKNKTGGNRNDDNKINYNRSTDSKTGKDKIIMNSKKVNTKRIYTEKTKRKRKRKHRNPVVWFLSALIILISLTFVIVKIWGKRPNENGPDHNGSLITSQNTHGFSSDFSGDVNSFQESDTDYGSENQNSGGENPSEGEVPSGDTTSVPVSSQSKTNPSISSADREKHFVNLKIELEKFIDNFPGRIGVYYHNLENEEIIEINESEPFVAASSIKMAIVTELFKKVDKGDLSLDQMIKYDSREYPQGDYEAGSGHIASLPNGTEFSLRKTAELAITISDNCATNMIIRTLGGIDKIVPQLYEISDIVKYRQSVYYKDCMDEKTGGRHRISSKDLGLYAVNTCDLYKGSRGHVYKPLIDYLQNTVFDFGLQAKLPTGTKVAHKIGTNSKYMTENDVGIIFGPETYVLAVTTETKNQSIGRNALADISLMIYEYISSMH